MIRPCPGSSPMTMYGLRKILEFILKGRSDTKDLRIRIHPEDWLSLERSSDNDYVFRASVRLSPMGMEPPSLTAHRVMEANHINGFSIMGIVTELDPGVPQGSLAFDHGPGTVAAMVEQSCTWTERLRRFSVDLENRGWTILGFPQENGTLVSVAWKPAEGLGKPTVHVTSVPSAEYSMENARASIEFLRKLIRSGEG